MQHGVRFVLLCYVLGVVMSTVTTNHCSCCCDVHLFFVPPVEYSVKDYIVKKFLLWVYSFEDLKR